MPHNYNSAGWKVEKYGKVCIKVDLKTNKQTKTFLELKEPFRDSQPSAQFLRAQL